MADNTDKKNIAEIEISDFSDSLFDTQSVLSDFRNEIPDIVEKILNETFDNDQEKLLIMAPF